MSNALSKIHSHQFLSDEEERFSESVIKIGLLSLYWPERIYTRRIIRLSDDLFRSYFFFPSYTKALTSAGHISANQVSEAIIESVLSVFCASALCDFPPFCAVKDKLTQLADLLVCIKQETIFRRFVAERSEDYLDVRIEPISLIKLRVSAYLVSISYTGFVEGRSDYIIDAQSVRALVGHDLLDATSPLRIRL